MLFVSGLGTGGRIGSLFPPGYQIESTMQSTENVVFLKLSLLNFLTMEHLVYYFVCYIYASRMERLYLNVYDYHEADFL